MMHWLEMTAMDPDWDDSPGVNPATGMPMINDAIDAGGNPFGTDLSDIGSSHDLFQYDSFDIGGTGLDW